MLATSLKEVEGAVRKQKTKQGARTASLGNTHHLYVSYTGLRLAVEQLSLKDCSATLYNWECTNVTLLPNTVGNWQKRCDLNISFSKQKS